MSSQAGNGSPFSIAGNQQSFRLLELPPELLELLSSSNPPKLHFKSIEAGHASNGPEAVLCTPEKTYMIRQQMTSNGVHVVAPSSMVLQEDIDSQLGLCSISQCISSLELMPAPVDTGKSILKDLLPLFLEPEDAEKHGFKYHDKDYFFANTPLSDTECHQVWIDLVAFELIPSKGLPSRCFRPSSNVLLQTWIRLLEISRAEGINLAGTLRTGTMLEALWNPDDEWPHELRAAVLNRLSSNRTTMSHQELAETALREGSTLDRATTVQWVGLLLLKAQLEKQPDSPRIAKDAFLDAWKEALPEEWRRDANVDALPEPSYVIAADYIRYAAEDIHNLPEEAAVSGASKPPKGATNNKRKWHEKFAAARKQKKPAS